MLDEDTIKAGLAGSEEELAAILDMVRHTTLALSRQRLCQKLRGRIGHEDVVQEALLEFSQAQKRGIEFLSVSQFGAFVNTIASRTLYQIVRRELNLKRGSDWKQIVVDGSKSLLNDMIGRQQTPSQEALAVERSTAIQDVIEMLDERQKITLELWYFQRLTLAEIGELLGEKRNTISSRLQRSRGRLFSLLKAQGYLSDHQFKDSGSPEP